MEEVVRTETQAQKSARQRRAAADRARRYRERKKDIQAPLPRDTDAALSEAASFLLARYGVLTPIQPPELMKCARLILEREGHSPDAARGAIADRLQSRPDHRWSNHFPALRPGPISQLRDTRTGPWTTDKAVIARFLGSPGA